jgi:hypothetical protein
MAACVMVLPTVTTFSLHHNRRGRSASTSHVENSQSTCSFIRLLEEKSPRSLYGSTGSLVELERQEDGDDLKSNNSIAKQCFSAAIRKREW